MAQQTFESAMERLERIVAELESGDPPLEAAIRKYEEGMRLARFCNHKLEETEKRISVLMADENGGLRERPLESTTSEDLEDV
jgi:exodeoxyribonuclease VII small subunit